MFKPDEKYCLDRIERIEKFERLFDEAVESPDPVKLRQLDAYYSSGQWQEDYEADERGELPPELKRGVLSQDALYDLLEGCCMTETKTMIFETPIPIGSLTLENRLVMPPMQTNKTDRGHVTDELVSYYRDRALYSRPGLVITEHSCITESGRAAEGQLSIADDTRIEEHKRLTEAIHEGGSRAFIQLNHAGSNGVGEPVSASEVSTPVKKLSRLPRALSAEEIRTIQERFAEAAVRAVKAGYDGVELHCAHGYLLNQFYSPLTNKRTDEYGGSLENRLRFLLETVVCVRSAIGADVPLTVRLGGADYMPGGSTEEDAVAASRLLEQAGVDLLDVSGGMCFFVRPDHPEPGYFSSMTEKIKAQVSVPVLLTGGISRITEAEELLLAGKADLIGVGRALLKDARWRDTA